MKSQRTRFFFILILTYSFFINALLYGAWRTSRDSMGDGEGIPIFTAETESTDKSFKLIIEFPTDNPCIPLISIISKGSIKFKTGTDNKYDNAVIIFPSSKEYLIDAHPVNDTVYEIYITRKQYNAMISDLKKEKKFSLSIISGNNNDIIINKKEFALDNAFNALESACKDCESAYLKNTDYVMADSGKRAFSKEDIQRLRLLSKNLLQIARNEIFARHGYIFSNKDLQKIFSAKEWYKPVKKDATLSAIEKANVDLIKSLEKE